MSKNIETSRGLGPIENMVLLGGGYLLRQFCLWAKTNRINVKVITAPRHAAEKLEGQSLKSFFKTNRIRHLVVENIGENRVKTFLGDNRNSFCLSLGAAWIFRKEIIETLFGGKLFNLHGTRLPQNRGGGGFSWQILMGNRFGACLMHLVDEGVDTGEIVACEEFLYPPACRRPVDYEKIYAEKNFKFVTQFIEKHKSSRVPLMSSGQAEYLSTYWPRLYDTLNGWIDWSWDAPEIERFICAFDEPYGGAQTFLNDKVVKLKCVCLSPQDGDFHSYQNGLIYRKSQGWFCVALKGSTLVVEEIFDKQGKSILHKIKTGDRLFTPLAFLDKAKIRANFTPKGVQFKN